jgi:hypothetical protein
MGLQIRYTSGVYFDDEENVVLKIGCWFPTLEGLDRSEISSQRTSATPLCNSARIYSPVLIGFVINNLILKMAFPSCLSKETLSETRPDGRDQKSTGNAVNADRSQIPSTHEGRSRYAQPRNPKIRFIRDPFFG